MIYLFKTTIISLFIFLNTNSLLFANYYTSSYSHNECTNGNEPSVINKHVLLNIDMAALSSDNRNIAMKIDEYGSGPYRLYGNINQSNKYYNINFYSTLKFTGNFSYIKRYYRFPYIENTRLHAVVRDENGKFSIINNKDNILRKTLFSDGYINYPYLQLGDHFKGEISEVMLTNPNLSDKGLNLYFSLKYGISDNTKDFSILIPSNYPNRYKEMIIFKDREIFSNDIFVLGDMQFNYENIDYSLSQGISHSVNTENQLGDLIVSINKTKNNDKLIDFFTENTYLFFASNGQDFSVEKKITNGYKLLRRKWRYITKGKFYNKDIKNIVLKLKTPDNIDSYRIFIDDDDKPENGYIKSVNLYLSKSEDKYKSVIINASDFKNGEYIYIAYKDSYSSIKSHINYSLKLMNPCKGKNNGYAKVLIDNPIHINKNDTHEYIDCNFSIPESKDGYTLEGLFAIRKCDINDLKAHFLLGQKDYISIGIINNYFCSIFKGKFYYLCNINEYPNDALFHHIALTVSNRKLELFIDGKTKASKDIVKTQNNNSTNHFCIGGNITNNNDLYKGYVLRTGIWSSVLTKEEMRILYTTKYKYDRNDNKLITAYEFNDVDSKKNITPISSKIKSKALFVSTDPIKYLYDYNIQWNDINNAKRKDFERHDLKKSKTYKLFVEHDGKKEKEFSFSLKEISLKASLIDVVGECCEHDLCNFGVRINESSISEYTYQNTFTYNFIEDEERRRILYNCNRLEVNYLEKEGEELLYNKQHNGKIHFKIIIIDNNSCSIKLDYIVNVHEIIKSKKISIKI